MTEVQKRILKLKENNHSIETIVRNLKATGFKQKNGKRYTAQGVKQNLAFALAKVAKEKLVTEALNPAQIKQGIISGVANTVTATTGFVQTIPSTAGLIRPASDLDNVKTILAMPLSADKRIALIAVLFK